MKPVFAFCIIAFLCSKTATAQFEQDLKMKALENYKKATSKQLFKTMPERTVPNTVVPQSLDTSNMGKQDRSVLKLTLKGNYTGTTDKGDEVYAMQPDNMPCLVPGKNFKSNMPIAKKQKQQNLMPLKGNEQQSQK